MLNKQQYVSLSFPDFYEPLLVAHIVTCDGAISYNQSEAMSCKLPVSVMT